MDAGKEAGRGARMVARSIAQRVGVVMIETGKHQQVAAMRFDGFKDSRQIERGPGLSGRPLPHDDAVRHVDERQPQRRCRGLRRRQSRPHGIQPGQRN
jgi:hypothetical protein